MSNVVSLSGEGRALKLSFGKTVLDNRVKGGVLEWPAFKTKLTTCIRTPEKIEAYFKLPKELQDRVKDVGYYVPGPYSGNKRKKAELKHRECLTLDLDFAPETWKKELKAVYAGYEFIIHTTHKHRKGFPRLRMVFPLARPVNEAEYEAIGRAIAAKSDIDWYDDTTYQFGRVMHLPSASVDGVFDTVENSGPWLNPDQILAEEYFDWRDTSEWAMSSRELEAPRIAHDKAEDPTEKKGVIGAFCREYSISRVIEEILPDVYAPGATDERYSFLGGTTSNGAIAYDDLWLYSHHGTDVAHMRLVNAFDLVRLHRFGELDAKAAPDTSPSKMPSFVAMADFANKFDNVRVDVLKGRMREYDNAFEDISIPKTDIADDEPYDDKWMAQLRLTEKKVIARSIDNLVQIMLHDPILRRSVRFNSFKGGLVAVKNLGPHRNDDKINGNTWTDAMEVWILHYIAQVYGVEWSAGKIAEAAGVIGHGNSFHPVREYLDALEWDGKARLDTFLVRLAGVKDSDYTRAVSRKTLVGAVARVFEPGIKFEYALTLEGLQGARKSSLLRALAVYDEWFCDGVSFGMDSKVLIEMTQGKWIVEIQELVARGHADNQHVKAFLSVQIDRARAAYGRNASDVARQFIITASTNESNYSTDTTGNRRSWPVKCTGNLNIDGLIHERDQLWAEAVLAYREGEQLYLSGEAKDQSGIEQAKRMEEDDWLPLIRDYIESPVAVGWYDDDMVFEDEFGPLPTVKRTHVCVREIWQHVLYRDIAQLDRRQSFRISGLLKRLIGHNTENYRLGKRFGVVMCYLIP